MNRRTQHRTIKASVFLKETSATARQEKVNELMANLGSKISEVVGTPALKGERGSETCEAVGPHQASERRHGRGATEEGVASRRLFVGMMCETALGSMMTCGICRHRPHDVGAGFVSLEPSYDAANDLVVGRVVCEACAAEHGPDEGRLAELFDERSVGLPWSYRDRPGIAFVGQFFNVNPRVPDGRRG
jgi:hypothetical protein